MPSSFTVLSELQLDWSQVLKRLPIHTRGILADINIKRIGLISDQFKYPIVAIEADNYLSLNKDIQFCSQLTHAINSQIVNKVGGVKFVAPVTGQGSEFLDKIIEEFDAQIVHIEGV